MYNKYSPWDTVPSTTPALQRVTKVLNGDRIARRKVDVRASIAQDVRCLATNDSERECVKW